MTENKDNPRRYRAYIETDKGGYMAWEYLTLLDAKKIYNLTLKRYALTADTVVRQGWEEMKAYELGEKA